MSVPFTAAGFRRGFLAGLPLILGSLLGGIVIGVAYKGLGFGLFAAIGFSAIVYSGTAQAVTLGMWGAPPPVAAMVLACVVANARYLVIGAHLRQLFADVPRRMMLPVLYLVGDASWMMTVAEADRGRRDAGYLLGASLPMGLGWIVGTGIGHAMPLALGGPLAVGAAFLPLGFVASLLPTQWKGMMSLLPWIASAGVAVAVAATLGGTWAMLIGGGVGTLICLMRGDDE